MLRPACKVADGRSAGGKTVKPYPRDDKDDPEIVFEVTENSMNYRL
jgi:hypothetical protein